MSTFELSSASASSSSTRIARPIPIRHRSGIVERNVDVDDDRDVEAEVGNQKRGKGGNVSEVVQVKQTDAVFGEITEEGPNYRNVGWISTTVLMVKSQVGLGVLSLPFALSTLGLVPGTLIILAMAAIITYCDWVVGVFKANHPDVYNIDDVGQKLGGKIGREIMALAFWLFMTFVAGSAYLGVSIALNAVSSHGACTAVFVAIATIIIGVPACIQTLGRVQALGWIGLVSLLGAIFTLTVAVGVQERPSLAPPTGPWDKDLVLFGSPSFQEAITAVSAIGFSFAGTPTFFPIVAEMRDQRLYARAMLTCQAFMTAVYLTVAIVVYYFCGQYVASPALGSAGVLLKKICYGLAIPGLLVSGILYTHFPAKYLFVRLLRGSDDLTRNTVRHWVYWISSVVFCLLFSYVIASAIPVFGGLVSLIGAFLGTMLCIQPMGAMWLYDNWKLKRTTSWYLFCSLNIFLIILGFFLQIAGTYGSIVDIMKSYKESGGAAAWSCADNSASS